MQYLVRQNDIGCKVALRAATEEDLVPGLRTSSECRGIRAGMRLGQGKGYATRARVISATSCTGGGSQT